jgi:molybdate transport system substrate-binding protein
VWYCLYISRENDLFSAEFRSRIAEAVVKGDAEIGITISTEIIYVKGAEIAGPLPPQMQNLSVYYAVLVTGTTQPQVGKVLIDFMLSPEAKSALKSSGVEPR